MNGSRMKELYDFRIVADYAHLLFKEDEGKRLGLTVRKIIISPSDPRFAKIGEIDRKLREEGKGGFFFSSTCNRSYTKSELQSARIFRMLSTSMFEPCGEDCGTKYDEKKECRYCGAGAKLVGVISQAKWQRISQRWWHNKSSVNGRVKREA